MRLYQSILSSDGLAYFMAAFNEVIFMKWDVNREIYFKFFCESINTHGTGVGVDDNNIKYLCVLKQTLLREKIINTLSKLELTKCKHIIAIRITLNFNLTH